MFEDYLNYLHSLGYSAKTINFYKSVLVNYYGKDLPQGKSIYTLRTILAVLSSYCKFKGGENPYQELLRKLRTPRPVKREIVSFQNIVREWESYSSGSEKLLLGFFIFTGARESEVLSLRWEDVNLAKGYVVYRGKGNKERIVPLPEKFTLYILQNHTIGSGRIFAYTHFKVYQIVSTFLSKFNLKYKKGAHTLRHIYATHLSSYLNIYELKELLGHESINTTAKYVHCNTLSIRNKLEGVL